jgi:hypothetical protein
MKQTRPSWWTLYITIALLLGLFVAEARAPFTQTGHQAAEIALVLLIFASLWVWLDANEHLLFDEEWKKWQPTSRPDEPSVRAKSKTRDKSILN